MTNIGERNSSSQCFSCENNKGEGPKTNKKGYGTSSQEDWVELVSSD